MVLLLMPASQKANPGDTLCAATGACSNIQPLKDRLRLTVDGTEVCEQVLGVAGKRASQDYKGLLDLAEDRTAEIVQLSMVLAQIHIWGLH